MADHAVTVELLVDGVWTEADAYVRDGITLSRGAPGEGQESPPSAASFTLDDRDSTWNPKNVTSSVYGQIGRNTAVRVSADSSVRLVAEAATWAPGRSLGGHDAWTEISASGILRRLQQGDTPIKSVAYRSLTSPADSSTRVAYWPLEEESDASMISSPVGSPTPSYAGEISFGAYTDGLSTPRMLTFSSTDALLFFSVPSYSSTEHKVLSLWTLPDPSLAANTVLMRLYCADGDVDFIDVEYGQTLDGTLRLLAYSGGSLVDSGSFADFSPYIVNQHFLMSVELTQDGADCDCRIFIENMDDGTLGVAADDTLTGVEVGRVFAIAVAQNDCTGASFGHLAVGSSIGTYAAFIGNVGGIVGARGYTGETAGERFERLAAEEGITVSVVGTASDTQLMGPQGIDTAVNLFRECATVDDGLLFEARDALELVMRTGRSRYNQAAALTLSFTGGHIGPGLAPVFDDLVTRNDVTVSRTNGSSVRAEQTSGPLNTQDPTDDPQGVGRYDTSLTLNCASDDDLAAQASWRLAKGTLDEARWPGITVDLDRAPSLITAVNALEIGDRVLLADLPVSWSADDASLLVLGISESYPSGTGSRRRTVTLNCEPASLYDSAGLVGDGAAGSVDLLGQAIDAAGSTLAAGINTSTTSLSVASTGPVWTTTSADWNTGLNGGGLFIDVGGEVMRVSAISGASSPQTFTVVRSVTGVTKSHSSGTAVTVRHPATVGL